MYCCCHQQQHLPLSISSKAEPINTSTNIHPLLVLAAYLAGQQPREKLIEILTNIQNGRHYYFTWTAPPDAPPGKYTLLSEMHLEGAVKHSGTAAEDFFYIEQLDLSTNAHGEVIIYNPGPEPVPVKLISYATDNHLQPETLEVFYLAPHSSRPVAITGKLVFLVYNEERITVAPAQPGAATPASQPAASFPAQRRSRHTRHLCTAARRRLMPGASPACSATYGKQPMA